MGRSSIMRWITVLILAATLHVHASESCWKKWTRFSIGRLMIATAGIGMAIAGTQYAVDHYTYEKLIEDLRKKDIRWGDQPSTRSDRVLEAEAERWTRIVADSNNPNGDLIHRRFLDGLEEAMAFAKGTRVSGTRWAVDKSGRTDRKKFKDDLLFLLKRDRDNYLAKASPSARDRAGQLMDSIEWAGARRAARNHDFLANSRTKLFDGLTLEDAYATMEWANNNPEKFKDLKKGIQNYFPRYVGGPLDRHTTAVGLQFFELDVEKVSPLNFSDVSPPVGEPFIVVRALARYIRESRDNGKRVETFQEAIDELIELGEKNP